MLRSSEFLWRLNREYVNRLARARSYLDLLEQMLVGSDAGSTDLFLTLQAMRAQLDDLGEEHRRWCYTEFYESPETKRVVHSAKDVRHALASFGQMRDRHSLDLSDLAGQLDDLPRPAPDVTRIPSGDLWSMTVMAIGDLTDFSHDVNVPDLA